MEKWMAHNKYRRPKPALSVDEFEIGETALLTGHFNENEKLIIDGGISLEELREVLNG